jgi:tetratricopeptide (TPR) repeat protein
MGDYRKSEEFFRRALTYDPGNADAMNNLANALLVQNRLPEARLLIEKALQISPKVAYLDTLREIQKRESIPPASPGKNPSGGNGI